MAVSNVVTRDALARDLQAWVEEHGGEMPMTAARDEVSWFFEHISDQITAGNEVRIHGFGAFKTTHRAARTGRNPRTGEPVKVAARRVVRFAPSTTLSTALKGGSSVAKTPAAKKAKR